MLFIVTPLELNTARYESAVRHMREPVWRADELPVLRPAATCQDELNSCSVILVLYNKNIRLGSVGLRFPGYDSSHTLSGQRFHLDFDKPIVNRNCSFATGHLSGRLEVDMSEEAIHAANLAAKLPAKPQQRACCTLQ